MLVKHAFCQLGSPIGLNCHQKLWNRTDKRIHHPKLATWNHGKKEEKTARAHSLWPIEKPHPPFNCHLPSTDNFSHQQWQEEHLSLDEGYCHLILPSLSVSWSHSGEKLTATKGHPYIYNPMGKKPCPLSLLPTSNFKGLFTLGVLQL